MSSLKSMFATNAKAEQEGVWVDYGNGIELKLARAGGKNVAYSKAMEVATQPHRRALQTGNLPNEVALAIQMDVYSRTILLDWKGVIEEDPATIPEGETGTPIPCNPVTVRAQFNEMQDFFLEVQELAMGISLFKDQVDEDDSGN